MPSRPIHQILSDRPFVSVSADTPVREVVRQMNALQRSAALVTEHGVLTGIFTERDAAFARVLDARGRIVADTRRDFVGWSISGEAGDTFSVTTASGLLVARAPIVIPGRSNGIAEVALRLAPLRERLARSRGVLLRFALAELAACAVFLALLSIELVQPVRALTLELEEAPASGIPKPVNLPRAAGDRKSVV